MAGKEEVINELLVTTAKYLLLKALPPPSLLGPLVGEGPQRPRSPVNGGRDGGKCSREHPFITEGCSFHESLVL